MAVTLHTQLGDLKVELRCDTAPRCSFNFLALAASGTYDGTPFHRLMPGFMVQGGDPAGTGKEANRSGAARFLMNFIRTTPMMREVCYRWRTRGRTRIDRSFLTFAPQPHLNDKYSVFWAFG